MFHVLAQEVTPAVPQIQGLSPTLQFLLTIAVMMIPLITALLKARQNGKTLDSVITGNEVGATEAMKVVEALVLRAKSGETVSPKDISAVASVFKTGIQKVAILEGTEENLAPRVQKVTTHLDPKELAKKLAPLLLFGFLFLSGCASPAEDYVRADAAVWVQIDDRVDAWIDSEPTYSPEKKDALHQLMTGRRARVSHALANLKKKDGEGK